ncbi:hypothetical protein [Vibrio phage vB_VhaS-tm]|nr:hypothetical protein [Vibrio phage vB_VhaS-tm]
MKILCKNDAGAMLKIEEPLDDDNHACVEVEMEGDLAFCFIDKQDACNIINHLIDVFELQPSDIGV